MKKLITWLAVLLFSGQVVAQTFPVNNLQVNGTSNFVGQGTFTLSPTGPTPTLGDSSTKLATTAFVQSAVTVTTPVVASNSALQALSTVGVSQVWRIGFTTSGDAPPLLYTASGSPCSINAGAGDNGAQVKSANNLCWVASFSSREYDVREWGVTGDGTTDDTSAIQAAINFGQTLPGGTIFFGTGIFKYTSLSVTGGIHFKGASRSGTYFLQNSTTNVGIVVNTASSVFFDGIFFEQTGTPTAGAAISLSAPGGTNNNSVIRDCVFATNWVGVDTINAALYTIDSNYFTQYVSVGLLVQNQFNVDGGDSVVTNNIFSAIGTTAVGIKQFSSGGLKILGNKLIGGGYGYQLSLASGASTSDLIITGNSIENQAVAGVQLSNPGGSGILFANVVISGNQFAGQGAPIAANDTHTGWLTALAITGNVIQLGATNNPVGIQITAASVFNVGGNTISGNGGTGTSFGILINATASQGLISPNIFNNLTTSISNASGSTSVVVIP